MTVVFWLVVLTLLGVGAIQAFREWQHETWLKGQVKDLDTELRRELDEK